MWDVLTLFITELPYCDEHKIPLFQSELYLSFPESEEIQIVIGKKRSGRMKAKRSGLVSIFTNNLFVDSFVRDC
jgi:hypothetical protein